jgi:uncharacterized protein (TIGR04255 family)
MESKLSAAAGSRKYPNPPIEEGLCQVRFAEPLTWSVATPGVLFEKLRDRYSAEPEAQEQVGATLQVGAEAPTPTFAVNRGPQRFIYKNPEGTRLLIANPHTFSVNSLRPYEDWENLRVRFRNGLETLRSVLPIPPVTEVTLRYVNRIFIPDPAADTDEYFNISVRTPEEGRAFYAGFVLRVEAILTDNVTRALSTFATIDTQPTGHNYLLDLEFRRLNLSLTDLDEIVAVADELKLKENAEFEGSITDKTRGLFQ